MIVYGNRGKPCSFAKTDLYSNLTPVTKCLNRTVIFWSTYGFVFASVWRMTKSYSWAFQLGAVLPGLLPAATLREGHTLEASETGGRLCISKYHTPEPSGKWANVCANLEDSGGPQGSLVTGSCGPEVWHVTLFTPKQQSHFLFSTDLELEKLLFSSPLHIPSQPFAFNEWEIWDSETAFSASVPSSQRGGQSREGFGVMEPYSHLYSEIR